MDAGFGFPGSSSGTGGIDVGEIFKMFCGGPGGGNL